MRRSADIFIPRRLYEVLGVIYRPGITVISTPDAIGRSALLRSFVARSRPDGSSCRFITRCGSAEECFAKLCRAVIGTEERQPLTQAEYEALSRKFAAAAVSKTTLLVLDDRYAAEMLLGNIRTARLLAEFFPISAVVVAEGLSELYRELCLSFGFRIIEHGALLLTPEETREYAGMRGIDRRSADMIYAASGGELFQARLCIMLMDRGEPFAGLTAQEMVDRAVWNALPPSARAAIYASVFADHLEDKLCDDLAENVGTLPGFSPEMFSREAVIREITKLNKAIPLISIDRRSGRVTCHKMLKRSAFSHYQTFPEETRRQLRLCLARHHIRVSQTFTAFCEYFLAGDYDAAAEVPADRSFSFPEMLSKAHILLRFVRECPLDCKPAIPRLLRTTALLMLTPYKEQLSGKFQEIISYLSAAPQYTDAERRSILAYANALRTYEVCYILDKMGRYIKTAYDLFSGENISPPPIFSWTLYAPSIFCLIHRYSADLATESGQFMRYQRMYSEIMCHGKYVDLVYSGEVLYYTGNLSAALEAMLAAAERCGEDGELPTRIAALFGAARCTLFMGMYLRFEALTNELTEILHQYGTTETGYMAALSLGCLRGLRGGDSVEIWRFYSFADDTILLNRYAVPFCYMVQAIVLLGQGEYTQLLERLPYFIGAAQAVSNETAELLLQLAGALCHIRLGADRKAVRIIKHVLDVIGDSGIIVPIAEAAALCPELLDFAGRSLPEDYGELLGKARELSQKFRKGVETIRTYEMSPRYEMDMMLAETVSAAAVSHEKQRAELGLTRRAFGYAMMAYRGMSNDFIARHFGTTENSVKSSLKRTFTRLEIKNRHQLRMFPQYFE